MSSKTVVGVRGSKFNVGAVVVPAGVESIAAEAFKDCRGLTSLTLPSGLTTIGNSAFAECRGLTSLTLPSGVTIGDYAFCWCSGLTSLTLPRGFTTIGESAFGFCNGLTSLTLPHSLVKVGKHAYDECRSLTSVVFRPSVSPAFIAWAVGSSRHRTNWQLTTLKQSRNVLRLITVMASYSRDVASVDPDGSKGVFERCPGLEKWRC